MKNEDVFLKNMEKFNKGDHFDGFVRTTDYENITFAHVLDSFKEESILEFIEKRGANLNIEYAEGSTALHVVTESGQTKVALALIEAGVQLNKVNKEGNTPLHTAVLAGQTQVALALIKAGAHLNVVNKVGLSPLRIAMGYGNNTVSRTLIKKGAIEHELDAFRLPRRIQGAQPDKLFRKDTNNKECIGLDRPPKNPKVRF